MVPPISGSVTRSAKQLLAGGLPPPGSQKHSSSKVPSGSSVTPSPDEKQRHSTTQVAAGDSTMPVAPSPPVILTQGQKLDIQVYRIDNHTGDMLSFSVETLDIDNALRIMSAHQNVIFDNIVKTPAIMSMIPTLQDPESVFSVPPPVSRTALMLDVPAAMDQMDP